MKNYEHKNTTIWWVVKTTNKFLMLATIFTVVFVSIASCNKKSKDSERPKSATIEELGQMNRDFAKAMNARDAEAAANLYDEHASILPPNEPIVTGRTNIQNYMQGFLDAGFVEGSSTTITAASDGDLGYEIGFFKLKFKGEDGAITEETIKVIELLKRNEDGKWMSIYGMWSANE